MQVILSADEAWSIMLLVTSQVVDGVDLSAEGKAAVKAWRTAHNEGSAGMTKLTKALNVAIGGVTEERESKPIRRAGRYESSKDRR